jgi:hypothetical protein
MNINEKSEIRKFQQFVKDSIDTNTYGIQAQEFTEDDWLNEYTSEIKDVIAGNNKESLAEVINNAKQGRLLERRVTRRCTYGGEVRISNEGEQNRINQEASDQIQ